VRPADIGAPHAWPSMCGSSWTLPATVMSFSTAHRAYNLITPLGEDALLVHTMEGSEGLSRLFEFNFTLMSLDDDIKPADIIGKRVRLELETLHDVRHWSGIFVSFGRTGTRQLGGQQETEVTVYQAQLVPWAWQLQLIEDSRIFQGKNVQEIIELLLGEAGLSDFEFHLNQTYPPLDYCVQYRESTFAFISRLLERAGIHYFFRHDAQAEVWVFTDNRDNNPVLDPRELRFALAAQDVEQDADDLVLTLTRRESLRSGRITLRDYDFVRPGDLLESSVPSVLQIGDNQSLERFLHPPAHFTEHDAGDRLARLLIEVEEADHDTLQGSGNARLMTPGYAFELIDHPDEALNQEYLVVSVQHTGTNNLVEENTQYRNHFSVIPHQATWRAALRTPKPHMHGPQTAMVVGPAGEEIHCDAHGRVKVQFHWDRRGKRDENSSCWLRVAQMWAGRGWGTMFIPRIGMEVVVDFLEGDPDAPLITGSVYNGVNVPPYALPAEATKSTLKSYSSKGGDGFNEIRFEDKKDNEQLFVHAQKDLDQRVGKDARVHIGQDDSLIVKRDRLQEINRDISLKTGRDRIVVAGRDDSLDVTGKQALKIGGSQSISISGAMNHSVGADASTSVAGTLYLKSGGNLVIESGANITLQVGGSFIAISAAGVDIHGPKTQINSSGAKQSGKAGKLVAPLAAIPALLAALADPGKAPEDGPEGQAGKGKPPQEMPDHQPDPAKTHWIEVELLDEAGQPVAGESVQVKLPDGSVSTGTTNDKGLYRVAGIDAGNCEVTFPDLDEKAWTPA
jgi:type VI secretion system secreted protein VgrG